MGSQIDPRLYSQPPLPSPQPHHHIPPGPPLHTHPSYSTEASRLPRIHSVSDSHAQPAQAQTFDARAQPYFYNTPARNPPLQPASAPHYQSSYTSQPTHQGSNADERYDSSPSIAEDRPANDINDPKRARACESCRGLKVRCDQEDPNKPCKRCAKAKRECIVTQPSRKRQKKTDNRVAELEKKIDALTASLQAHGDYPGSTDANGHGKSDADTPPVESSYNKSNGDQDPETTCMKTSITRAVTGKRKSLAGHESRASKRPHSLEPAHQTADQPSPPTNSSRTAGLHVNEPLQSSPAFVSARISEVISDHEATQIFYRYVMTMATHLPAVVFPPDTKAEEVRNDRPVAFLSILVAASVGLKSIEIQERLNALLLGILADSIVRNGEKSLDLIQALLIATIWYRPPQRYEQMNFYQLGHMAAVMAIEMGMGKRSFASRASRNQPGSEEIRMPNFVFNPETLEARRTWLGCYFNCANTSMTQRRPALIRWNAYMSECVEALETSEARLATDAILCRHVKLQHLNEDIGARFSMDDPSAAITISDKPVQVALKKLEHQMDGMIKDLQESDHESAAHTAQFIPRDALAALAYSCEVTKLYMHEIALHINHNVDDFRAPFTEESLKASTGQSLVVSAAHSRAIAQCWAAVQGMMDTFFNFDAAMIRALPIFYFVRVAYAVVVLIKLHFAVTAPGSEVSKIVKKEDLRVGEYLDRLIQIFVAMDSDNAFRPAHRFLLILFRMRKWFEKDKESRDQAQDLLLYEPPASGAAGQAVKQEDKPPTAKPSERQQPEILPCQRQAQAGRQIQYDNSTPLHLLSDVAANAPNVNPRPASSAETDDRRATRSYQYPEPQNHATRQLDQPWYGNWTQGQAVPGVASATSTEGGAFGIPFETAMDMTLGGTGSSELSNMFTGDPHFDFAGGYEGYSNGYWQPPM